MPDTENPLSTLERLIADAATGELICAAPSLEVHVFLQNGRVAWCTESGKPFAFTRKLFELTELDSETFRHLLEECRRDRLPLGETLIQWRVASFEEVREALRHQIVEALASLVSQEQAQLLFLERSREFAEYDPALTFDLDDVLPVSPSAETAKDGCLGRDPAELVRRLRDQVPEALWVLVIEDGRRLAHHPASAPETDLIEPLAALSLDDGADFLAVRTALGTLLGTQIPGSSRSLWCALSVECTFGAAFSALTSILRLDAHAGAAGDPAGDLGAIAQEGASEAGPAILSFMERAGDVLAVSLLDRDGCGAYRALRETSEISAAIDAPERRRPILERASAAEDLLPRGGRGDLGPLQKTMVTGEGNFWCFGTEVVADPDETLWLLTSRHTSQGLGWAYLSALCRQMPRRREQ